MHCIIIIIVDSIDIIIKTCHSNWNFHKAQWISIMNIRNSKTMIKENSQSITINNFLWVTLLMLPVLSGRRWGGYVRKYLMDWRTKVKCNSKQNTLVITLVNKNPKNCLTELTCKWIYLQNALFLLLCFKAVYAHPWVKP